MSAKDKDATEGDLSEKRQRNLVAGVLKQTARDLRHFRGERAKPGQKLYLDAYRWLANNARDFSTWFALLSPLIGVMSASSACSR